MANNPDQRDLDQFSTDENSLENFSFTFTETLTSNGPVSSLLGLVLVFVWFNNL